MAYLRTVQIVPALEMLQRNKKALLLETDEATLTVVPSDDAFGPHFVIEGNHARHVLLFTRGEAEEIVRFLKDIYKLR